MAYEYTLPAHIVVGEKALEKAGPKEFLEEREAKKQKKQNP